MSNRRRRRTPREGGDERDGDALDGDNKRVGDAPAEAPPDPPLSLPRRDLRGPRLRPARGPTPRVPRNPETEGLLAVIFGVSIFGIALAALRVTPPQRDLRGTRPPSPPRRDLRGPRLRPARGPTPRVPRNPETEGLLAVIFGVSIFGLALAALGVSAMTVLKTFVGTILNVFLVPRILYQAIGWGVPFQNRAPPGLARTSARAAVDSLAPMGSAQRTYALIFVPCACIFVCALVSVLLRALGLFHRVEALWKTRFPEHALRLLSFLATVAMLEDALAKSSWFAPGRFVLTHLAYVSFASSLMSMSIEFIQLAYGVLGYAFATALALVAAPRVTASTTCSKALFIAGCLVAVVTTEGVVIALAKQLGLRVFPLRTLGRSARFVIQYMPWEKIGRIVTGFRRATANATFIVLDAMVHVFWIATDGFLRYIYDPFVQYVYFPILNAWYWFVNDVLVKTCGLIRDKLVVPLLRAAVKTCGLIRDKLVVPVIATFDRLMARVVPPLLLSIEPLLAVVAAWEFASASMDAPSPSCATPFAAAAVAMTSVALIICGRSLTASTLPLGRVFANAGLAVFLNLDVGFTHMASRALAFVFRETYNALAVLASKLRDAFIGFLRRYVLPAARRIIQNAYMTIKGGLEIIWKSPLLATIASAGAMAALVAVHRAGHLEAFPGVIISALDRHLPAIAASLDHANVAIDEAKRLWTLTAPLRSVALAAAARMDATVTTGSARAMFSDDGFAWLVYGAVAAAGTLTDIHDVVSRVDDPDRARSAMREVLSARAEIGARVVLKTLLAPALFRTICIWASSWIGMGSDRVFDVVFGWLSRAFFGCAAVTIVLLRWAAHLDIRGGDGGRGEPMRDAREGAEKIVLEAKRCPPRRRFLNETCVVCVDALSEDSCGEKGKDAVWLPCGHCFHEDCIAEWLARRPLCPTCRRDARASVFSRVTM